MTQVGFGVDWHVARRASVDALVKRATRLSERFSAIASLTDDTAANEELKAASSEGGSLLKRCYEAGFISLGPQNDSFLIGIFGQAEESHCPSMQELRQVGWFDALVFQLSDKANPHGFVFEELVVSKKDCERARSGVSTSNWRLRARNYSDFCFDLAETIASYREGATELAALRTGFVQAALDFTQIINLHLPPQPPPQVYVVPPQYEPNEHDEKPGGKQHDRLMLHVRKQRELSPQSPQQSYEQITKTLPDFGFWHGHNHATVNRWFNEWSKPKKGN